MPYKRKKHERGTKYKQSCVFYLQEASSQEMFQGDFVGKDVHVPVGHAGLGGVHHSAVGSQHPVVNHLLVGGELPVRRIRASDV